jgi:hypothetical protein
MWVYFIYITLFQIILDFSSSPMSTCIIKHPSIIPIQIYHHLINNFLLFGWLFDKTPVLVFHLLICVSIIIYWMYNSKTTKLCFLTVKVNNICGWPIDKPFNDIISLIGLKSVKGWNSFWNYIIVSFIASISVYKIYNNVVSRKLKSKSKNKYENRDDNKDEYKYKLLN